MLDRQVMTVLIRPIRADLHISDVQFGLLQGLAFGIFYAVLGVPIAYFADFADRRKLIASGLLLWSAMTMAGAVARSFTLLFATRMVVGVGEAALNPAAYSLLADALPARRLGRGLGLFAGALVMSTGLSVFISGNLAAWFTAHVGNLWGLAPWRLTMLAIALPAPLLALFLLYSIAEPRRPTQTGPSAWSPKVIWQEIAKDRGLVAWMILGAAFSTIHINVQLTWIPAYFQRLHQYSLSQVAWNLGIVTMVAGLLGPILSGMVSDLLYPRLGARAPIIILVCITLGAFAQAAAPLATDPRLALAGFAVGYLMLTGGYALAPAVIQIRCAPTVRARVSSLYIAVANLAGLSLGPVAVPLAVRYLFSSNEKDLGLAIATLSALLLSLALVCFLRAYAVTPRLKGV